MTRVGWIGLGNQGGPMARRVAEEGFSLTAWARRPESFEILSGTSAARAASPFEVGRASEIVGICVVADADVEEVLLGEDGVLAGMDARGIVLIHSTVHPDTCRRIAEAASSRQVSVVDAPVSGGGAMAAQRRLLVMAGGADEDLDRCRPVLETFADPLIHLGPLGSGEMAKLLNNLVFTAQITVAMETFAFAAALGVDRSALAEVLAHGSGGSRVAAILAASGFDVTGLKGAAGLLRKDVGIMLDVAARAGASEPEVMVDLARRTLDSLAGQGGAAE